jgi:hypothetical protein
MKRILIPFLLCAGIVTYLSCQKENSSDLIRAQAAKDAANARRATDSSSDSTHHSDTTGTDTCRYCLLHDTTFSLAGDQILIVPVKADSGSYSGLYITATTQNTYPCANTTLVTDLVQYDSGYTVGYYGAHITGFCIPGQSQAHSTKVLFPVQDGTHAFTVVFNNAIYRGSFTKTGSHYSFTWPYSSGVTISPLTIN